MANGIATVMKVDEGIVYLLLEAGGVSDETQVKVDGEGPLGQERLWGCESGDQFNVSVDIIPPRISTRTHLDLIAIDDPLIPTG